MLARQAKERAGGTLGEHLVLAGSIDDETLTAFYATRLRVPRVSDRELAAVTPAALRKIPRDMAVEFRILPVAADGEQNLTVAMSDPSDRHAVEEVAFFTGCYVVRAVASQAQIARGLAHYYGVVTPLAQPPEPPEPPEVPEAVAKPPAAAEPAPVAPHDEAPTAPHRPRAQLVVMETDEERDRQLAPRSGELTAQPPPREPERLPAVVVDDLDDEAEEPILLEQPVRGGGDGGGSGEQVVELDQPRRRRRTSRQTEPGIGRLGTVDSRREARQDTDVSSSPPWGGEISQEEATVSRSEKRQSKSNRSSSGASKGGPKGATGSTGATGGGTPGGTNDAPAPAAAKTPAAPARSKTPSVDDGWDVDDGWGPPGTTIPPAFLGAAPKALEDSPSSGRIPLAVGDEGTGEVLQAENAAAEPSAPTATPEENTAPHQAAASLPAPVAMPATPEPIDPAELARQLELSSTRLLETVRKLERAPGRDEVIDSLLDHLGGLCQRRAFLAIKAGTLHPFRQQGASRPGVGTATLALGQPSTLSQVATTRLPYHGALSPEAADFIAAALGAGPEADVVAIPILLRDRAIALLYGDGISGRVFDEHQMVLGRAAGQALERILMSAKS